jgi:hypothetical protein
LFRADFYEQKVVKAFHELDWYPFFGHHELMSRNYPRPVGGSPVTTPTPAGGR